MTSATTCINNDLPCFPVATDASKFSDLEDVLLLEWSLPDHWRAKFDYDGYIPTEGNKTKLIAACEAIERNEANAKPDATPANNKKENTKKGKFASKQQKHDENKAGEACSYYCRRCGKNPHHNTAQCKKIQADNRANNKFSSSHPPNKRSFSNKGFSKEVNMLARGPACAKTLKKMERAITAEIALDKKRKLSSDSENESEHELQHIESHKTSKKQKEKPKKKKAEKESKLLKKTPEEQAFLEKVWAIDSEESELENEPLDNASSSDDSEEST